MRPKSLALLLLALGCGLVASIGITEVLAKRNAEPAGATDETQPIFIAISDVPLGDLVTPQLLKLEQWPKGKIPKGAISRIEDLEGRRTRTKLYAGEPILENRLLGKGASEQGATALIPKGYRVVPVKVDLVSGGSSLIMPGDRVDVMVHLVRDTAREIQETVTRTILQDIKVFAVDDVVDLEREKEGTKNIAAKTISLLVTPEQAAKLMLATQLGIINLVMRSPEDDLQIANAQARPGELFGDQSKANRKKESLLQGETNLNEKAKGFLDFLGETKDKTAVNPTTTAKATPEKPHETWIMRILKPGDVESVQLGLDDNNSGGIWSSSEWKSMTMATGAAGASSAKDASPVIVPPGADSAQEPVKNQLPPQ
jgi:pilus assembly protein CpaB